MYRCRFCGGDQSAREFTAREMMFGMRDEFTYHECGSCSSLQIAHIPEDLSRYYPPGYGSFTVRRDGLVKRWLQKQRFRTAIDRGNFIGRLMVRWRGAPWLATWLPRTGVAPDDRILDVGSGNGQLLLQMHDCGFRNLTGIDPFIEEDRLDGPVMIRRQTIGQVTDPYDMVMFNHSLEHVRQPEDDLRAAGLLLQTGQPAIVRLPVAGTSAYRSYGGEWVQLDAPRHLGIPSESGMRALAARAGFTMELVQYESTAFQFWGSEQYRAGIPLTDERSYQRNPDRSPFTPQQILEFQQQADRLNEAGDGDTACFFLRRNSPEETSPERRDTGSV